MKLKTLCFTLIIIFLGLNMYSQRLKSKNLPTFEQKKYHFGFSMGGNSSSFSVARFPQSTFPKDSLQRVESSSRISFNLGILASYRFSRNLTLRLVPSLYFSEKNLIFTYFYLPDTKRIYTKQANITYANIPLLFKYKSERLNNLAAYILLGGSYNYNFSSNINANNKGLIAYDKIVLKYTPHEFNIEAGIGVDFYLSYFKLSLEMKMVYSVFNNSINDNTPFSRSIESLRNNMMVFSLLFEGGRKY